MGRGVGWGDEVRAQKIYLYPFPLWFRKAWQFRELGAAS